MKDSARYVKIVEWSEEDQCYIGSSPGLIYGGCRGDDERIVFDELGRNHQWTFWFIRGRCSKANLKEEEPA